MEHFAAVDPQARTLSRIDDAAFAPKTPRGPPFERVIELRGQPRHCQQGYRAATKWCDGPAALGNIGDIGATIADGAFACAEVGSQIGPNFGKTAGRDARIDTQALEQGAVGVEIRIAGGEKFVAVENRVRAGEVTQRLC